MRTSGTLIGAVAGVVAFIVVFMDPVSGLLNLLVGIANLFSSEPVRLGLAGGQLRAIFPLTEWFHHVMDGIVPIGITEVRSSDFGGFVLSVTIGVAAISLSLPLGILLALGRQSDMLFVKMFVGWLHRIHPRCAADHACCSRLRLLLQYFLPPGTSFDIILRVVIMVTLFAAAYIAEVMRGGLAALPRGQYEAADASGPELLAGAAPDHLAAGAENLDSRASCPPLSACSKTPRWWCSSAFWTR